MSQPGHERNSRTAGPPDQKLPPGQAADRPAWEASIGRVRSMTPSRVHFCHHADVVHA